MSLSNRVGWLERHAGGAPGEARESVAFLSALVAFGRHQANVTPETAAEVREAANDRRARALSVRVVDWVRDLHAMSRESL